MLGIEESGIYFIVVGTVMSTRLHEDIDRLTVSEDLIEEAKIPFRHIRQDLSVNLIGEPIWYEGKWQAHVRIMFKIEEGDESISRYSSSESDVISRQTRNPFSGAGKDTRTGW